jgi:hypothetical protein
LRCGRARVDDQDAAVRFQHATNLACAELACLSRQMVEHQRAQHHVEARVWERQRVCDRFTINLAVGAQSSESSPSAFLF